MLLKYGSVPRVYKCLKLPRPRLVTLLAKQQKWFAENPICKLLESQFRQKIGNAPVGIERTIANKRIEIHLNYANKLAAQFTLSI